MDNFENELPGDQIGLLKEIAQQLRDVNGNSNGTYELLHDQIFLTMKAKLDAMDKALEAIQKKVIEIEQSVSMRG